MREFVAIEISEEIRRSLGRLESHLKYSGADVKWVAPESIHLTLKFLGEVSESRTEEVRSRLDSIASSRAAFDISAGAIGAFPKVESPRVIWVGLDKGAAETISIAGAVDEALSSAGFAKEARPFSPHLTIGRVRSPLNKVKLAEKISSAAEGFRPSDIPPHRVSSLVLFQSTLTPKGPLHTRLHESPLGKI